MQKLYKDTEERCRDQKNIIIGSIEKIKKSFYNMTGSGDNEYAVSRVENEIEQLSSQDPSTLTWVQPVVLAGCIDSALLFRAREENQTPTHTNYELNNYAGGFIGIKASLAIAMVVLVCTVLVNT